MTSISDGEFADLTGAQQEEPEFTNPPCWIYFKDGRIIQVSDGEDWQWHPRGVFCIGYFIDQKESGKRDYLVPMESIDFMQFDFSEQEPDE